MRRSFGNSFGKHDNLLQKSKGSRPQSEGTFNYKKLISEKQTQAIEERKKVREKLLIELKSLSE